MSTDHNNLRPENVTEPSRSLSDRDLAEGPEGSNVRAARLGLAHSNLNRDIPQPIEAPLTPELVRKIIRESVSSVGDVLVRALEVRELQPSRGSRNPTQDLTQVMTGQDNGVRIGDVRLSEFHGNPDSKASFVDPDYYLQLLSWIKDCSVVLRASGLDVRRQVLCMIGHLRGAARHAFMTRHQEADIGSWTLDTLIGALAALIPEHQTLFTRKAVEMRFSKLSLRDNIETFSLLVKHGEVPQNSHFWFDQLQRKLLEASPSILSDASDLYNLRLGWRQGMSFVDMITQTIEIVSRLQADGRLLKPRVQAGLPAGDAESYVPPPAWGGQRQNNGAKPGRRGPGVQGSGTVKQKAKITNGNKPSFNELRQLAKTYDRCFDCGLHCPPGTLADHRLKCPKDKHLFKTRLGRVRNWVHNRGVTDYAKINNFEKAPVPGNKNSGAGGSKPCA
jgi:hypothetical protein